MQSSVKQFSDTKTKVGHGHVSCVILKITSFCDKLIANYPTFLKNLLYESSGYSKTTILDYMKVKAAGSQRRSSPIINQSLTTHEILASINRAVKT
jgi:hypothetical protein